MHPLACTGRQQGGSAPGQNLPSSGRALAICRRIGRSFSDSDAARARTARRCSCAARKLLNSHAQQLLVQHGGLRLCANLLHAQLPARLPVRQHRRRQAATASADRQRAASDVTLWAGDAIVLLLTQMSSDRLPMENQGLTSILLLTAWTAVAGAKRDYELSSADYDFWNVRAPVLSAIQSAALTWVLFAPLAAAMYGRLASQHLLRVPADAAPQLPLVTGFGAAPMWLLPPSTDASQLLAPELEVIIAALFCVGAWRGLYSAYRTWSNFR